MQALFAPIVYFPNTIWTHKIEPNGLLMLNSLEIKAKESFIPCLFLRH